MILFLDKFGPLFNQKIRKILEDHAFLVLICFKKFAKFFISQYWGGGGNTCNILSSRKEENKEAGDLFVVQFQAMATQLENYNG
jgi:hypothetical protein